MDAVEEPVGLGRRGEGVAEGREAPSLLLHKGLQDAHELLLGADLRAVGQLLQQLGEQQQVPLGQPGQRGSRAAPPGPRVGRSLSLPLSLSLSLALDLALSLSRSDVPI